MFWNEPVLMETNEVTYLIVASWEVPLGESHGMRQILNAAKNVEREPGRGANAQAVK